MSRSSGEVHEVLEQFFRRKAGQLVSTLTRFFGPGNLDAAEGVVQETLLKACQLWPHSGIPENPGGWITTVAKNHALDLVRREKRFRDKEKAIRLWLEQHTPAPSDRVEEEVIDDQLRLMFICCHPVLSRRAQVCLTLKTVGGFSAPEVARALVSGEAAVRRLLTRAKQSIRDAELPFELPPPAERAARLDAVLDVLYLIFNEGYSASHGDALVRHELCDEAIRLARLLVQGSAGDVPRLPAIKALLALMLLQSSRLPARTDADGNLVLLADQDRSLWNTERIEAGMQYLRESAAGDELSSYHVEAHIAACHAVAPSYEKSDWRRIISLYDMLLDLNPGPVVALNRAVAVGMADGPEAGLAELDRLTVAGTLANYHLLPAAFGDFHRQLHRYGKAAEYYRQALVLAGTAAEQRFLHRRIQECSAQQN